MSKGRRLSIWIPQEDLWIIEAIEKSRQMFEAKGISISQAELILKVLRPGFEAVAERFGESVGVVTNEEVPKTDDSIKSSRRVGVPIIG